MTEIAFTAAFRKALKRKFRKNPTLEKRFWERVNIFRNDPHDPRLRTHQLSGAMKGWWSFSIDYDVRVVVLFVEPNKAVFADIGTHDEVY